MSYFLMASGSERLGGEGLIGLQPMTALMAES